jgi:ribonucleoside-diphosphate reductase alpha chain
MLRRVAKYISLADSQYGENPKISEKNFYDAMVNFEFLPNSPTLMNAGTELGQLFACFVYPIEDSLESIFDTLKYAALTHQSGGGTGYNFSHIRPRGDVVRSTKGVASGPVSFMKIYDTMTEVIKQGGKRRGANMGILNVDHPDILEFITSKTDENGVNLRNFNISVAVTNDFMRKAIKREDYNLINPRTGKSEKRLNAGKVFDLIVNTAWKTGDPGLIFLDEINKNNPTPSLGNIEATNPCGEVPLLPYEPCVLGSINLSKVVSNKKKIDWNKLRYLIYTGVRFLDNTIDANRFPIPEVEKICKGNRKIGLGVMGFADMLIKLGIPYNSKKACKLAEKIMKFIRDESHYASVELAKERGSFPNFKGSIWEKKGYKMIRNATTTTVAPTGTISIIAGCSSGIEPLFAVSFVRNILDNKRLAEGNELFENVAIQRGFYSRELMAKIARSGSVQNMNEIPEDVQKIFVTSLDIDPEWHVLMQAAFQKYTDNAVSKTANLPYDATPEDVRRIYLLAWKLHCKGITVYRYGSKEEQVLYVGEIVGKKNDKGYIRVKPEYGGGPQTGACSGGDCVL